MKLKQLLQSWRTKNETKDSKHKFEFFIEFDTINAIVNISKN